MKTLIIDISSRRLEVFSGSVTQIPGCDGPDRKIVIRHGASLGDAKDLFPEYTANQVYRGEQKAYHDLGLGLVITGSAYQAESSAGFTGVFGASPSGTVVASCGCLGAKGLRPIKPLTARVYAPGKWLLYRCDVHRNKNVVTASAALAGIEYLVKQRGLTAITQGDSNTTTAFVVGGCPVWFHYGTWAGRGLGPLRGYQDPDGGLLVRDDWNVVPAEHAAWLVDMFLPTTTVGVQSASV